MIYESFFEKDTFDYAYKLGINANPGDIYCLSGDLGSGKTVFAKGFAKGLEVDGIITSPTFIIINQYEGRLPFYHFDVYRIESPDEMDSLGFDEYLYGDGVCLIEWAEVIKSLIPEGAHWIRIEKDIQKGLNYRKIEVSK